MMCRFWWVRGVELEMKRCWARAGAGAGLEDWGSPVPVAPDPDGDSTPAASFGASLLPFPPGFLPGIILNT